MMALSKCVLDRVSERKNGLKGRMYGLVEIMSRSVFARMQKRTCTYKNLLDQLVDDVFGVFKHELNDAWRDGCAHGRDWELSLNQHISNNEEYGMDSEIDDDSLSISTFESQTSSPEQSLDEVVDDDDEEYYSIMAQMDGVDQFVLDRVEKRKNEFKGRAYGLLEIMSRTVFARMEKRTSVYKDLLDQLVEQVFNKFIQELNGAWRDGCAYGRDEWNVYLDFDDLFEDQPEINYLDSIEPLSSPHHSNEDSSLHSSPTLSQSSSQSQHQNIIQDDEHISYLGPLTCTDQASFTQFQSSLQQSNLECNLDEVVEDGEYAENSCDNDMMGSMCTDDQDKDQSEEYDRDDQISANDEELSLVNGQVDGDGKNDEVGEECDDDDGAEVNEIDEDDQHGVDQLNVLEHESNIDGNKAQEGQLAQNKSAGQVAGPVHKSPTGKHVCEHCGKGFKGRYNLIVHIRIHTGDRPYKCPKCPKTFTQSVHMKQHIITQHDKLQIGKYVCSHCPKRFPSQSKLEYHIRTHTGERPHKCPFDNCNKAFAQIRIMQGHYKRVHTEHRPYVCEHCYKRFGSQGDLIRHKRTHTGEKPYKCPKCPKTFNQSVHMKRHIMTQHDKSQTGKLAYEQCRISFSTLSDLNHHTRKYAVSKLIKCPWPNCYKAFAQKADLQVHLESHSGQNTLGNKEELDIDLHVEENERSGKGSRCNELDNEQMDSDEDDENVGNNEELTGQMGDDDDFGHGIDELNGLEHRNNNIDGTDVIVDQLGQNISTGNEIVPNMSPTGKHVCKLCSKGFKRGYNLACPFAWGGCTKTFTDDGHLQKHLKLIHRNHLSRYQNSNKVDQLHSEIVTESVQIPPTLSQSLAQLLPNINKDDQYVTDDSKNNEVGESEMEDMDEQQIGNGEELPMADDLHRNEHGDCQLNGHKHGSNIEGADTRGLAQNIQSGQVVVFDKPPKGKHVCVHCGKGFKHPSALTVHLRVHTDERPYVCPHENCTKAFTQIGTMHIHHRIHTGERPHVCIQCEMTFQTNSKLTRHIRTHTGERPHKCHHCGMSFIQINALKTHLMIHTGERPHVCEQCSKSFRTKSDLKKHLNVHQRNPRLK